MNKLLLHIIGVAFLLLVFLNAGAQDTTQLTPDQMLDSLVAVPPVEMADTVYQTSSSSYQFKEITTANKVEIRAVPQQQLSKLKSDDDYWYVNTAPKREKKEYKAPEKPNSIFDQAWFKTLFWILLIGGFLALLIWFLATSNIHLFSRKSKSVTEEAINEEEGENIFEMNFEKEIQKAIDASNYRMAVRLMYLRTLRDLSLRNRIAYTHEKTNSDYLFQLAGTPYYKNFFRLTRDFDYTWYGHFPLTQDSFTVIQNEFNTFKQQLS